MPRYSRRIRRYYRSRSRWSANIQEISTSVVNAEVGANIATYTLAFNPTQVNTAVSQVYTVKNFEITFSPEYPSNASSAIANNIEDISAYIVFVPQGMVVGTDYNIQHPEYVMAYKFYGSPSADANGPTVYRIRTRLSRKLNTGDSIQLLIKYNNQYTQALTGTVFELHGLCRWWTKAN